MNVFACLQPFTCFLKEIHLLKAASKTICFGIWHVVVFAIGVSIMNIATVLDISSDIPNLAWHGGPMDMLANVLVYGGYCILK
jgi:hypothetical protein